MDSQAPATRKAPGTPGTTGQAQQRRGLATIHHREQTGNTAGTTGNKQDPARRICSRCSRYFQQPGTAGSRAVTGCSRCSRCSRSKQQGRHAGFAPRKPLKPARRLACSRFFSAQKWRATLHGRTLSTSLQAAPFLGCSGFRGVRAQFAQFAHTHRAQGWKHRRAWAADEFTARAECPPRAVNGCESARLCALIGEGAQPCASA